MNRVSNMSQTSRRTKLSRRTVVRGLGAASLFPSLGTAIGRAQQEGAGDKPKRLLVMQLSNVVWSSDWVASGGRAVDAGQGDATTFRYGPQSAVFEPIRQHTTLIEGLPLLGVVGDPHSAGQIHFNTGSTIASARPGAETSALPSMDQIISRRAPGMAAGGAAPSVTWSAHTQGDAVRRHIHLCSFDNSRKPAPIFPQNSPLLAYQSMFSGFMPGQTSDAQRQALVRALEQERSVLDFVQGSITQLSSRVSAEEKTRLDNHAQALRELEMRFAEPPQQPSLFAGVDLPDPSTLRGLKLNNAADHRAVLEGFMTLAKTSFGFDRTRVGTLMFSSGHNYVNFNGIIPGLIRKGRVHAVSHLNYKDKNLDMRRISDFYGGILSSFVQELSETPDVDGSSMLDNTLLVLYAEVSIAGNGTAAIHSHANTPLVMIGGKNIGHVGGRYLRYRRRNTTDFWTSVGRQFGLAEDFVMGDPAIGNGGLPELFQPA